MVLQMFAGVAPVGEGPSSSGLFPSRAILDGLLCVTVRYDVATNDSHIF